MENRPKKTQWTFGKQMPEFSGKSFVELNDIYPINHRIKDDAWKMVGLIYPAWMITRKKMKDHVIGDMIAFTRFCELCYIQRCEEGFSGFATHAYPVIKGMDTAAKYFYARKAALTKAGLIENIPTKKAGARLYRVTATGKLMIKTFTENLNQANNNLQMWLEALDEEHRKKIMYYLLKCWPQWNEGI